MATPIHPSIYIATAIGLTMNAYFSSGSLALTYFSIPAILLPENAQLMPPLEFVHQRKKNHFRTENPSTKESSTLLSSPPKPNPSTTSFLIRQWFHLFAKGMHTYPPLAPGATLMYLYCAIMLPGPLLGTADPFLVAKRGFYVAAALLSIGIVVFTLTALRPVNSALQRRVEDVLALEKEGGSEAAEKRAETEDLIREWGRMNAVRAMLPVAAGVCAAVGLAVPLGS